MVAAVRGVDCDNRSYRRCDFDLGRGADDSQQGPWGHVLRARRRWLVCTNRNDICACATAVHRGVLGCVLAAHRVVRHVMRGDADRADVAHLARAAKPLTPHCVAGPT